MGSGAPPPEVLIQWSWVVGICIFNSLSQWFWWRWHGAHNLSNTGFRRRGQNCFFPRIRPSVDSDPSQTSRRVLLEKVFGKEIIYIHPQRLKEWVNQKLGSHLDGLEDKQQNPKVPEKFWLLLVWGPTVQLFLSPSSFHSRRTKEAK